MRTRETENRRKFSLEEEEQEVARSLRLPTLMMMMMVMMRYSGRRRCVIRRRRIRDRTKGGSSRGRGRVQMMMMVMMRRMMGMMMNRGRRADLVPQYPRDAAHRWHVVFIAHAIRQQTIPDLPSEDTRILQFQLFDILDHLRGGDTGFTATDRARQYAACLVVPGQDLADTTMADSQLPRDVARPDAQLCKLHYSQPDRIWQGSAIYEHTP